MKKHWPKNRSKLGLMLINTHVNTQIFHCATKYKETIWYRRDVISVWIQATIFMQFSRWKIPPEKSYPKKIRELLMRMAFETEYLHILVLLISAKKKRSFISDEQKDKYPVDVVTASHKITGTIFQKSHLIKNGPNTINEPKNTPKLVRMKKSGAVKICFKNGFKMA